MGALFGGAWKIIRRGGFAAPPSAFGTFPRKRGKERRALARNAVRGNPYNASSSLAMTCSSRSPSVPSTRITRSSSAASRNSYRRFSHRCR